MSAMKYQEISYVKKKVSRIFFGTAMEPFLSGGDADDLLDSITGLGINALDMARNYAGAETAVGRWMKKRENRDELVLLSKCGHPDVDGRKRINEKEIREDFCNTVRELGTDFIDIYILHRDDIQTQAGMIVEIFNALHAEGKIGAFGGSNWTHRRIEEANEYAYKHNLIPFTISSPQFGLAEQIEDPWGGGCITISGSSNTVAREWYRKNQMPIIAYSSLGRGLFSGRVKSAQVERASEYMDAFAIKGFAGAENFERLRRCELLAQQKGCFVSQIAMAWIFHQNLNAFAAIGTSKVESMQKNIDALSISLTEKECAYLDLQSEKI